MRFIDYAKRDSIGASEYVRLTYWTGELNIWQVIEVDEESERVNVLNVSDWRGLEHRNVPLTDTRSLTFEQAREGMNRGLEQARRDHRNAMRRTLEARRDGAEHGKNAATWVEIGGEDDARRILEAMDEGTFWDGLETEYDQTYAGDEEKWAAYTEAHDSAWSAEVERAARYQLDGAE